MKKGFTLVELSIVLVIIGLLIGGVLVGQSLIDSAKLNKLQKQISQYDIAVGLFISQFRAYPGDFARAATIWGSVAGNCKTDVGTGTQTCSGDGNWQINADCCGATSQHESLRFWEHLQNAKMLESTLSGASANNCVGNQSCYTPDINSPSTNFGKDTAVSIFTSMSTNGIAWSGKAETRNTWYLGRPQSQDNATYLGRPHGNFFKPIDARVYDAKFDDGFPYTGSITTLGNSSYSNCTGGSYTAPGSYNISYGNNACSMLIDAQKY